MTTRRLLRAATVGLMVLGLTACAGLPTGGPVNAGLRAGDVDTTLDRTFLPDGPMPGAGPGEILAGFLEAATSPTDNWAIAKEFLSEELTASWQPDAAVTVDRSWSTRSIDGDVDEDAGVASLTMTLTPVASLDASGVYSESSDRPSETPFELERDAEGEWRITSASDGIVLDAESFREVFRRYPLQYFDPAWEHLVPDARWFPQTSTIATTITQAVVSGRPSDWLEGSVRSAFPPEVLLARDAVPVSGEDRVAEVALTSSALSLDESTLGRMRAQLERSLAPAGVNTVRFTVEGSELAAESAEIALNRIDANSVVLTETVFGRHRDSDDEIVPFPGVSPLVMGITEPIAAIDLAGDERSAAVLLESGSVYRVGEGPVDELDDRPELIAPSLDASSFIWTVPGDAPQEVIAWSPDVVQYPIEGAWPDASSISHMRLSPDGVRVAALLTVGGQDWVALAAILRDDGGEPVSFGPTEMLTRVSGDGIGLAWLGDDSLGVLAADGETKQLIEILIGGPSSASVVPAEMVFIAGANSVAGARLLSSGGVVSIKRGTSWQESIDGVRVLATQSAR